MTPGEAVRKLLGKNPEEAIKELEAMPDVGEVVIYTRRIKELVDAIEGRGLEVIAQYPMVNALVVKGPKKEVLKLLDDELVEAFDIPRKVFKLESKA